MTDKSAARKNVEHVGLVMTFKNHQTSVGLHGSRVSISSRQLSTRLSGPTLRKPSPVGGDNPL